MLIFLLEQIVLLIKVQLKLNSMKLFETTISAIIEETYQNGNYYIKGRKEMLIEGQKQNIVVSGVIRPYDITSNNSINFLKLLI